MCEFETSIDELIAGVRAWGIHCVEFIPIRNTPEALAKYALRMREAGLVVTAGTEHNTPDLLPIEPRCVGGAPVPPEVAEVFWEGTCVVVGHVAARCQGRPGFVDELGSPASGYGDGEARIRTFRDIGAAVIAECARR